MPTINYATTLSAITLSNANTMLSNENKDRLDEIEKKIELMERINKKVKWKRRRKWR